MGCPPMFSGDLRCAPSRWLTREVDSHRQIQDALSDHDDGSAFHNHAAKPNKQVVPIGSRRTAFAVSLSNPVVI